MMRKSAVFWFVAGGLLAAALALAVGFLPLDAIIVVLTVVVGAMSGVYFGVALSPAGGKNAVLNIAASLVFFALALAGAWLSPLFFALACFLHAGWDLVIAHPKALNLPIARWYAPLCISADIVFGAFILAWFL